MSAREERDPYFYFAVPRGAPKAARERVPAHIFKHFGLELIPGTVEHVRSEGWFHLYRIAVPA